MTTTGIMPGYQLHLYSWENDGDHSKTITHNGLTEADVEFYIDLASKFKSRNGRPKGFGNGSIDDEDLVDLIERTLDKHPNISTSVWTNWTITQSGADNTRAERWYESLQSLVLGSPVEDAYNEEHHFCRVSDGFKVYFIPGEIEDVTGQFE